MTFVVFSAVISDWNGSWTLYCMQLLSTVIHRMLCVRVTDVHWELIYPVSFNNVTSLCHELKSCRSMNEMWCVCTTTVSDTVSESVCLSTDFTWIMKLLQLVVTMKWLLVDCGTFNVCCWHFCRHLNVMLCGFLTNLSALGRKINVAWPQDI